MKKRFLTQLLILLGFSFFNLSALQAENLVIAAGAGYKKPVTQIMKAFQEKNSIEVDAIFGNLRMVANQTRQSGEVACIIGDKKFLKKLQKIVHFSDYSTLGKGVLVLAYRQGISLKTPADILSGEVKSVFMPRDGRAIYGIAGREALHSYGYYDNIKNKLTEVATVPQVISYLLTGEADAGFINLTEALANRDKIGGFLIIPDDKYTRIDIVAGVISEFKEKSTTRKFIDFLNTEKARQILTQYGL